MIQQSLDNKFLENVLSRFIFFKCFVEQCEIRQFCLAFMLFFFEQSLQPFYFVAQLQIC